MADLPVEGRTVVDVKENALTLEERVDFLTKDVQEMARGINTQARLLESIVISFDNVVKKYIELTGPTSETKEETK